VNISLSSSKSLEVFFYFSPSECVLFFFCFHPSNMFLTHRHRISDRFHLKMPSILSPNPTGSSNPSAAASSPAPKKKFRTVLGLASLGDFTNGNPNHNSGSHSPAANSVSFEDDHPVLIMTRNSSHRRSPSQVTDPDFYSPGSPKSDTSSLAVEEMKIDLSQLPTLPQQQHQTLAPFARFQTQWGPWSISAAETAHSNRTYNLYIKSELTFLPFVYLFIV